LTVIPIVTYDTTVAHIYIRLGDVVDLMIYFLQNFTSDLALRRSCFS